MREIGIIVGAMVLAAWAVAQAQEISVRTVEDRDHVTIMEFSGVYDHQPEASRTSEIAARQAVAKEFLRAHADDYDFLVIFTRFDYDLGSDAEGQIGGRYYAIRNDVTGIGQDPFDYSAEFGSGGRLQGYIDMRPLSKLATDPTDPSFEQTLSTLAHEFGHRWAAYVRFKDSDGSLSTALLGLEAAHWNFLLQTHNSLYYGNEWRDNGDGIFTSIGRSKSFYSPLDLYLMGFLEKSQVPPFFLIQNPNIDPGRLPEVGVTVTGTKKIITIDDIIAAEGERVPSAKDAPKQFKVGFIYLVRPGENVEAVELTRINAIREAFSTRMIVLTNGKAGVQVFPEQPREIPSPPPPGLPPPSGPRTSPVDVAQALAWLLARQSADGAWGDSRWTRVRDTAAALELLREIPSSNGAYLRGLAWLNGFSEFGNIDTVSRRVMAIAPQSSSTESTFLLQAANPSGGWGIGKGYQSNPLDTALALVALPQNGRAQDIAYLLAAQNTDGGWGAHPDSPSSVLATLAVLRLGERYQSGSLNLALTRAQGWLETRQNGDGGFGSSPSTVYETALAILFLAKTTFPKDQLAKALDYLRNTQLANGSWRESAYETALAIRALKVGDLPNASINAASITFSPGNPVEGQPVTITAQVLNNGVQDLVNLKVRFYDGDPAAGGVPIGSDITISSLPALSQLPVKVDWETTGKAGDHVLFVVVDSNQQMDESNELDNIASKAITVRAPPTIPDLLVTSGDLTLTPPLLQSIPQGETLTAKISNLGQPAASQVKVWVYDGDPSAGGTKIADALVEVPGRGSATTNLSFTIASAGEHRFFLAVDPLGEVAEADEANNRASIALPVQPTLDFFVIPGSISISENPIGLGKDLTVSATVANQGSSDAFSVPVRLFIEDAQGFIDLGSPAVDLPAGQSRTLSVVWRTSRPFNRVPVVVQVDPANTFAENSKNNNRDSAPLTVLSSTDANLYVAYQELQVTTPVKQGGSATISIPVHNNGFADAMNGEVAFYLGVPGSGGVQIGATQVIPRLAPGEQATVQVVWDSISTSGDKLIYAVVDPANTVTEFDEGDNSAFIAVKVLSLPDLLLTAGGIAFSPVFPKEGDPVVITVTVTNDGDQAAANVRARFFDGNPASGGIQIGSEQIISEVPGRGQAVTQVVLEDSSRAGTRDIHVQVDPLNEIRELDETNNTAFRTLGIQDSSLFFSNLYFSPNGDGLQDDTELFFRFNPQEVAGAAIYNRRGEQVRTIPVAGQPTASGSIPWDGRDEKGRIVDDGAYTCSLAAPDGREVAAARVVVDTDNSPVTDAVGTTYLVQTNLTCGLKTVGGPLRRAGWLPDDSGLLVWSQTAVYVVSPDGQTVTRLTPDSWEIRPPFAFEGVAINDVKLSPDGRKVLITERRFNGSFMTVWFENYWVVNTDGSGLTLVATSGVTADRLEFGKRPEWAPDSQKFARLEEYRVGFTRVAQLFVVWVGGGPYTPLSDPAGGFPYDFSWSPDSQRLLFVTTRHSTAIPQRMYAVNSDGTGLVKLAETDGIPSINDVAWLAGDRFAKVMPGDPTPEGFFYSYGAPRLWLFTTAGDPPRLISGDGETINEIVGSPDRRRAAYTDFSEYDSSTDALRSRVSSGIWVFGAEGLPDKVYTATGTNRGVRNLKWTPDGQKLAFTEEVVTSHETCDDGEGGEYFCGTIFLAVGTIDLRDRTVRLFPATDPIDRATSGGPSLYPLGPFPGGQSYLFLSDEQDRRSLVAVSLVEGTKVTILEDPWMPFSPGTYFNPVEISPGGKYLDFESSRESHDQTTACWKGSFTTDRWVVASLLNLTTQFTFQRDGSQVVILGTAVDLNFREFHLEYAPVSSPDAWAPIGDPSDTPVINGELARWIPPSEGTYYVRLTASDKAGNQRSIIRRITWGLSPTITNVLISPRVFSGNGDGRSDAVTINYTVLGPVHLEFRIYDAQETLVKTIIQDHAVIGPASIAWDGRDEGGQFVADGIYRIDVLDYTFFVTMDTSLPDIGMAVGGAFRTVPNKIHCQQTLQGQVCSLLPGPLVETPHHLLTGHVSDAHLASWRLEVGQGVNPPEWGLVAEGTDLLVGRDSGGAPKTPIEDVILQRFDQAGDVVGKKFRLTAEDEAGNLRTLVTEFAPQEVILHAWDQLPVPTTLVIEQQPGPHALSIVQTVRTPLQALTVQYRLKGSVLWNDGPALSLPSASVELSWDTGSLAAGRTYDVRVVGRDFDGNEFVSNAIVIHSEVFVMTSLDQSRGISYGTASLRETLTDIRLVAAAPGEEEMGVGPAAFSTPTDFSIPINVARLCQARVSAIPLRYKGVGQSGKVYYSNAVTFVPPCQGEPGGSGTPTSRLLLKVLTDPAPDCGLPTPGRVTIELSGIGLEPGSEKLFIQDLPNGILKEAQGVTLPVVLQLDTKGRPEGTYAVRATARAFGADPTTEETTAVGSFIVDRTPPTGRITYPGPNQAFCPVKSGIRVVVPIEGIVEDPNLDHYELEYGLGDNPGKWVRFFPAAGDEAASRTPKQGILANWDVTDLSSGTYSLRLKVFDKGGNVVCHTVSFSLERGTRIQSLTADRRIFSPSGSGVPGSVLLSYAIEKNALIDAKVYPVQGGQAGPTAVRTILAKAQQLAGTNSFLWDGLTDAGAPAADGLYAVVVTATDACGNTAQASVQVEVDNTPPEAVITFPQATDALGRVVDVRGSTGDPHFDRATVEVGETHAPVTWSLLATLVAPVQNGLLAKWNTGGKAGPSTLRLTAKDTAGNQRQALVLLTVPQLPPLVSDLSATPILISPNRDGKLDTASISYGLGANSQVLLEVVDGWGTAVRTLASAGGVAPGSYAALWDGTNGAGVRVPDGEYTIRITATATADPTQTQTERTAVKVDATPPAAAVDTPADQAHVKGDVAVIGTAADANLESYSVTLTPQGGGAPVILDQGNQSRTGFAFGAIKGLADGTYILKVSATDLAQNGTEKTITLTLDNTGPKVTLTAPADGVLVGGAKGSVAVKGSVIEANLREWTLRFGSGPDPQSWTTITTQTTLPTAEVLATWEVGSLADGPYSLSLLVADKAGSVAEARLSIVVDNTPPAALLTQPTEGARIAAPIEIRGDAADAHLKSAILELSEGDAATAFKYVTLATLNTPVKGGSLFSWRALPPDGTYALRLSVEDEVGLRSVTKRTVKVDTQPPEPPTGLTAQAEDRRNARLTWTASPEKELAGYHVYRDGKKITSAIVTGTSYLDGNLTDGSYRYQVTAVDLALLESVPTNEARAQIDLTPPTTRLQAPVNGAVVGGLVDIRGSATGDDLKEYRILVRDESAATAWNLIRRSPAPVSSGPLAQWETLGLPEGGLFTIRLETEDLSGNQGSDQAAVRIDNAPPKAPVLLSATPGGSEISVQWMANTESDLAGYLLFSNDLLANVDRIVTGSFTPYLLSGTMFADRGLPDGTYKYTAYAVDKAGNISDPSNTVTAIVETGAPRATIIQPATGSKTEKPILLVATTADQDVVRVQFQVKAAADSTWTDLGGPVTGRPYQVTWDPNGLAYGSYNFRAVATDSNGKTDPSPTPMTIIHQDVTPPGPPGGLEVKVIEGTAALNWSANMEADLAGYHVYRRDDQGSPVKVTATPVMGTAFADPNLADGLYTYTVTAVDSTGNESDPSDPVAGQVYTPLAAVPNACLAASTTALSGSGVAPSSTVTLFVDIGQGPAASGSVQAAADGTFQFSAVPLVAGKNTLSVQATDPTGNASKKSAPLDVQYSPLPPAPSGLAALVNGFEVSLAWDAPTGPVVGYNLYRNGAPLNQIVDATSGGVPGASSFLYFSYYPPSDAVDGNPDTFWIPHFEGDPTPWWQLDFGTPILVKEVQINWYGSPPYVYGGRDFEVQRWDGSTWVAVQAFRDNDAARNVVTLANPVLTSRVRILITRSIFDLPYLTEVRVLKKDFIPGTDFTDSDLPNGKYTYTLKALNLCGVEGPAAEVTAAVGDVIPPAPVLNLTASVNGSDVTLQWTGGSDADLAGYNLYRNDGDGAWKKINTSPIPGTNFLDALVPNGSHAYRVTAQDATGNEGDPSNEAVAVVNVSAPPAPIQLVVEVRPEGGSLDISWGSGDPTKPIAGYRLFRGLTGGGPYAQLNQALITATTYRDAGLTNGVTYYYVVKAVDPANNESNPSNEGSGIPTDTVTPGPPVIQYPTDAAQPMTVTSSLTRVAGTSEPGTVVTLLREGIGVGTTAALSAPATESFSLDSYPESSIACYGPGSLLAGFWTSTGGTQNVLAITDVMTRQTRYYAAAIEGSSPAFSPDGTKIAYTAYDNGYRLYLFDRVAGAIVLTIALPDYASEFAFSPSGTQIALNMNGQLWILDLPTGGMTQLTTDGYALSSPVWSPDGQKIVYVFTPDFSTASLRLIDVTSKSVTDLDTNPVIEPPVFSPDGKSLAFASFRRGRAELWIHEMAAGAATQIPPGSGSRISPVFSPDGTALAYLELNPNTDTYGLHVRRLATGEAVVVAENGYDRRPCWISDGTLVQQDGETVARVRPAGHFLFDNVHLEVGENILSAVAGDTSGNISRPSEAIVLTLEATGRTDLAVGETDFFVYPLYPAPGETVRMSATVRNPSAVPATGIEVIFFATDTDGTISPIGSAQTLVGMDPGEEVTVSTDWQTTGLTGRHTLIVSVDPFNRIEETSEANNTARKTVLITAGGTPVLSMATNGSSFAPAGIVQVSVEATNPGPAGDFVLDLLIEDSQGFEVASLFKQPLPGFGQTSRTFSASWSATGTLAGAYRARAILTRASGEQYDATAPFTIEADRRAVITVGTDRVSYPSGEPVRIIGRVENTSPNAELTDLSTLTQVLDGTGAERFRETGALGTLFRRTQVEMPSRWSAGTPGNYTVRFTVESAGTEMGTASAAFSVTGVARLEGQLRVSPGVVPIGAGFAFAATAANTGTLDTGPVTLRLVLIDPDSQTILRSFERVVDLPAGGAIPWEVSGSSIGLAPKTYTISLQAQVLSLQILAAGILSVVDGQAPTVQILSPAPGTYHNRDVSVMAVATDDASGVDRVEIQITGGPWTQMTPADLAAGRYALLYPALPASEGTRTLTVRASDKAGNSADTSSSDPNPVSVSFVVDITPPQLAVSGITDGAVVNGDVVPGIQITDVNLADSTVLLDGAPYISGTPLSVEKNYLLEIRARDLAGNVSDLTIQFTIDKTAPDITITGVEDGGTYRTAVIPIITIAETGAFTSSIQLNGAPFSSGTGIVENGQYTLEVVATDQAGNTTRRVVRFAVARNRAPVANAGSDQTVNEGHTISLDGSGSFDPDGAPLIFAWTQTAGPPVQLSDPAGAKPTFAAPAVTADTILAFQVTVTDSQAAGDSATVNITVKDVNNPPLANAGADRNVVVEQPVTLDGTASYDPDGDLITYRWIVVSVPVGSLVTNASLSDLTSAKPILTPDVPGPYTLGLVVNDGQVDSEKDEVIILAELPPNIPPNADAGPDQQVFTGSLVILNGSRSNDPNNGPQPLIYEWSFVRVPDGSFLTDNSIAGRVSVEATFIPDVGGEYVVNLTVFDGQNNGSDQVSVFASVNTPPVADAGPDITIARGQTVILNGSGSSDPDSRPGPLTYLWRLVSRPALSRLTDADIRDAGTVTPSFLPDVGGVYVLSLTVSDGLASSTDNVAVTVETTERAFGGAYFLHDGYQEKLSLDVLALNGTVQVTSWLKYFYTKTRTNLVSTQILSLSVVGTTATITGVATMNGANGYRFTATVSDAAPDRFGIVIYRQDGTVWYDEPPQAIVGGDLIIQQQ